MVSSAEIAKKLGVEIPVSNEMQEALSEWSDAYTNDSYWLQDDIVSLELASEIASETSRLVTGGGKSWVSGSERGKYIQSQYENFMANIRRHVEFACALGGIVFKPYLIGKSIKVDVITADRFFPVKFGSDGEINAAVFCEKRTIGKKNYTRLEYHDLDENSGIYTVQNRAFVSNDKSDLGNECYLSEVSVWSDQTENMVIRDTEKPLFAYYKMPAANNIDMTSPLGMSCYQKAIEQIRQADQHWERIMWEYQGSELAVMAERSMFHVENGKPAIPRGKKGTHVFYPTGHSDMIDVAVRRSVLTGVGQTVRKLSEIDANEMGCDIMELTAHAGARPDHAAWQGKLVSLSGKNAGKIIEGCRVLSLAEIGYGTGAGFGGWNCRHDWYPFYVGISKRAYSDKRLAELNEKNIEYNGKKYTEYEISQMQRSMERSIRKTKRRIIAADTGRQNADSDELKQAFDNEFTKQSVKLKAKEEKLNDFLQRTGTLPDNARTQVVGFGRSVAQKAVWAKKKSPISLTDFIKNSKIEEREKLFRDYLKLGKFNTAIDYSQQDKHLQTKVWKNQVKQTILGNNNGTPRSRLNKGIDPQELVKKYGGTGTIEFSHDGSAVNEYIVLPETVGVTFNKKTGKFEKAYVIQIKYTEKGTHVFPTTPKKEK